MHFVFDLDGTICFKGQCVSDKIASCLEQLSRSGHEVILPRHGRFATCYPYFLNAFTPML